MSVTFRKAHLMDRALMIAARTLLAFQPKAKLVPAERHNFDALMEKTPAAQGVAFKAATIADVAGWWCLPRAAAKNSAVVYLHGGAYVLGSASAYRNFCSQIAKRAGVAIFVVEYGLAPEHPFPKAVNDAEAVYGGLIQEGFSKLAIAGDSAGGGLALALVQLLTAAALQGLGTMPVGAAVFSPWADLALTGESLSAHAQADPLLTRDALLAAANLYLGQHDRRDPRASPVFGDFTGFPPTLLHVGKDEVLLDDAVRIAERIDAAGSVSELNVWQGMTHVFPSNLHLQAGKEALDQAGSFLRQRFSL